MRENVVNPGKNRVVRLLVAIYILFGLIVVVAGYFIFQAQQDRWLRSASEEIAAIGQMKRDEIARWRQARLAHAKLILADAEMMRLVRDWLDSAAQPGAEAKIRIWLRAQVEIFDYCGFFLLDAGRVRIGDAPRGETIGPVGLELAHRASSLGQPVFSDIHTAAPDGDPHIDLVIPVPAGAKRGPGTTSGTILLRIDPARFLYPFIQQWPTPSPTAETLLVSREGDEVVYLNELRHRKGTALKLRFPSADMKLPAALAVSGFEGVAKGKDYRGVAVQAAMYAIPDSPWFIVSKVDAAEVEAPGRRLALLIGLIVLGTAFSTGIGLAYIWRLIEAAHLRRQLELKRKHDALADRIAYLVDHANDIIILTEWNWQILEANARAVEAYGYPLDELTRMNMADLRAPEERAAFAAQSSLLDERNGAVYETLHRRKDGTLFPIESSARTIEVAGVRYHQSIIRDITKRKQAERERAETLTDLERSNRELEQFAYVASHDLQEPLRMVASYTQLLAERYEGRLDDKARMYIQYAVEGAVRMQRLINDLLAFSRIGTRGVHIEPTDSEKALDEALANLSEAIEESRAVIGKGPLPTVKADPVQLVQLFQNLVGNAIKFRRPDEPPAIHVAAELVKAPDTGPSGREWRFSIKDNGIGIDPQFKDRIFVIFQRLHSRDEYPGTGIGLALCKRIVERHGGRIWLESEPGQGSTFFFTLPE